MDSQKPCPHCGYCPTCGRAYTYPYQTYPYWSNPQWYPPYPWATPWIVSSGTTATWYSNPSGTTIQDCAVTGSMGAITFTN